MPAFYGAGLNPAALPGAAAAAAPGTVTREIAFYPGYQGMRLGPWTLPRTVPPHHLEEGQFGLENLLGLGAAVGLRLGIPATPSQVEAAALGLAYSVLPPRSNYFPLMCRLPHARRRRPLPRRCLRAAPHTVGAHHVGAAGPGRHRAGLVPGIGSGLQVDGCGWEFVGARLEATTALYDDSTASYTTEALGYVAALKTSTGGLLGGHSTAATPPPPAVHCGPRLRLPPLTLTLLLSRRRRLMATVGRTGMSLWWPPPPTRRSL